ncbi:hypothetical protein BP6252_14027 [Coleophoma cylindrospora]|uniref:Uncharacterized protein n=1 Tax=Coleophoma cylindrospora TaxID=1849047 RepID=A0A3D8Q4E2_9HELO|nr:hypothetical protein BP6252_14027 [Coleophoma cylindrospora]
MSFTELIHDQKTPLPVVPETETCKGGTFIVTGANTGLGFECAKHLVNLSARRVILGVRSLSKGKAAEAKITAETGREGVVEVLHLDLTSHDSVKEFAKTVQELDRVDAIIENAGVALDKYTISEGLETTLTVNVISTMLLAVLVLPKLQESAKRFNISPHLVVVGSAVAFMAKGELEKINGDPLDGLKESGMGNRYAVSKLMQLYAVRHLAATRPVIETGVVINYLNPGLTKTELSRDTGLVSRVMVGIMRATLARTAEIGSRTLLHAAVVGKEGHGKYISECDIKEYKIPSWVTDDSGTHMQTLVWERISKKLNTIQPGCV